MTKVFLVSTGSYSDYGILAAFSTEEKAEELCKILGSDSHIETYDIDPEVGDYTQYTVFMLKDGSLLNKVYSMKIVFPAVPRVWFGQDPRSPDGNVLIYIAIAKSEEQAIKAANEHRAHAIAMETWGKNP